MIKRILFLFFLLLAVSSYGQEIQCPIPEKDRVFNSTGTQCVYASIETLGRWAECQALQNLTKRPDCQSFSNPQSIAPILNQLNVRFEQSIDDYNRGLQLIQKGTGEGRGVLFGARRRHAMVLIHFDLPASTVKWIDNLDPNLAIKTGTVDQFYQIWDSWVLIIYANPDVIPKKLKVCILRRH